MGAHSPEQNSRYHAVVITVYLYNTINSEGGTGHWGEIFQG